VRNSVRWGIVVAIGLLVGLASSPAASGEALGYAGLYETPEGRLRLHEVESGFVAGSYFEDEVHGRLTGVVEDGRLRVEWRGEDTQGDGWIALEEEGRAFRGAWRVRGDQTWHDWEGERVLEDAELTWLVVLESDWERELDAPDYAFGEMLEAYFRSNPYVAFRHRRFDNRSGLESLIRQVAHLPERVFLVIAGHGEGGRLKIGRDRISPSALGEMLRDAPNVFGLHLASCESMSEGAPEALLASLGGRKIPVSGYVESVDWLGGALIDLLYLDLVLNREIPPVDAASFVSRQIVFANADAKDAGLLGRAGFRLLEMRESAQRDRKRLEAPDAHNGRLVAQGGGVDGER
jgi:hypothetical protein